MKKIFTLFTALLVVCAVSATLPSTNFEDPGYYCTAESGVITGTAPSNKVCLNSTADPKQIEWSDVSKSYTSVVTWEFHATRACYISVKLDLGTAVSSNKHIFEVKLLDSEENVLGALEEGPAYTGDGFTEANQVKVLSGRLLIPAEGDYKIELRNNRDYCKGSIKNIILIYDGAAPETNFPPAGYFCTAVNGVISGTAPSNKVYLNSTADPKQIEWSDVSKEYTSVVSWKIIATRACRVSVDLDLGTAVSSNKHIFQVKILDVKGSTMGTVEEGPAYTGDGFTEAEQVKSLSGTIDIPRAGVYTVELRNNRDFCKGSIKNVILKGHYYTVAGNNTAVFGTAYDATNTDNDMEFVDGQYVFVKKSVDITAGHILFQVVEDHDWSVAYPAGYGNNWDLNVGSDGNYDIRVYFNPSSHDISALAVTTTPRPVKLAGTFYESINPDWAISAQTMDDAEDHLTCSKIVSLQPGFYEFKIVDNGTWNGNTGDMVRTNCTGWVMTSATDERCGITIDVAGDYIFTYNYFDYKASVTYPMTFTREVANTNYGTICLPCAAVLTGATAYSVDPAHVAEGYVTLTEVGTELTAGVPYIIKPEAVGTISAVMSGDAVASPVNNNLYGVWGATQTLSAGDGVYALHDNKLTLVSGSAKVNVPSTKAYFKVAAASAPVLRILEGEEIVTNISDVKDEEQTIKFIENGQLFIRKNGIVYDALGRAVR